MNKYSGKIIIPRFIVIYNIDFFNIPKLKVIKYIINKIRVEIILASHAHHVPHVGIPHMAPETKAINVVIAPIGAIDLTK